MNKIDALLQYIAQRIAEPGTWQGIAFLLALGGSRYANLDWGQCAALGASVSGVLKIVLPDSKNVLSLPSSTPQQRSETMNAVSYLTLIESLLSAFSTAFPKASTLQHANAVTGIVGATLTATNTVSGTVDPTVTAISAALPVVVQSVQDIRLATAAVTTTATNVAASGSTTSTAEVVEPTPTPAATTTTTAA
jgi:hypothetical protein